MDLYEKKKECRKDWKDKKIPVGDTIEAFFEFYLKKDGELFLSPANASLDIWRSGDTLGSFAEKVFKAMESGYRKKGFEIVKSEIISKEKYEEASIKCKKSARLFFSYFDGEIAVVEYFADGFKIGSEEEKEQSDLESKA